MSWWVYLEDLDGTVQVPSHAGGAIAEVGGTDRAEMNVTYNYSRLFREAWPEALPPSNALAAMLDGRTARETEPLLAEAIEALGTEPPAEDYWEPTKGNARRALWLLRGWAREHPDARWRVS